MAGPSPVKTIFEADAREPGAPFVLARPHPPAASAAGPPSPAVRERVLSRRNQAGGLSNQYDAAKADIRMPSCATPGTTMRVHRQGTPSLAASAWPRAR
jgi:hypothetical protein